MNRTLEERDTDIFEKLVESFILLHRRQFQAIGLPKIYWRELFTKLTNEVFDAGSYFEIKKRVAEDDGKALGYKVFCITDLTKNDSKGVFLVDHAWTYNVNDAKKHLRESEQLVCRMCELMNIDESDVDIKETDDAETINDKKVVAVFENMWKYNQTYKIATDKKSDKERESIWYIMDEFGSAICHSDQPNVRCAPLFFTPFNIMYSVIWPIEDLKQGDEVTRDYVFGIKDKLERECRLIPWIDNYDYNKGAHREQSDPNLEYFTFNRQELILPDDFKLAKNSTDFVLNCQKINVYTTLKLVRDYLTDEKFVIVDSIEKADIQWIRKRIVDYKSLQEKSPNVLVSQFGHEENLTTKDLLAITCRRINDCKDWQPTTYNLYNELPQFLYHWKQREEENLDNYWILKPWNLSRSSDMTITKNLNHILRYLETGPKVACKYIVNPVTLNITKSAGVKFDLRFHVLLRNARPLKIFCTKLFSVRCGNKPFEMSEFEDFEKHFTTMKYRNYYLTEMSYIEFIVAFEKQYPNFKWHDIEQKCYGIIRKIFEGATKEQGPKGLVHNPQSRALYGIDILLNWIEDTTNDYKTIQPMICEVNFMPDCGRALKTDPQFFNNVFNFLFVGNYSKDKITEI